MQKSVNILNKKAKFEYEFLERFTAGLVLKGTEIKSIREGKARIAESFCQFKEDELYVINMNVDEYSHGNIYNHAPKRDRKLLLNKRELKRLQNKIKDKGLSIIPTKLFINENGHAKLNIALAKGKKMHDKRQDLKAQDAKRSMDRAKKSF
ncbi:MAG: SsrA-binding protein SmpB [Bacteroidota bacterium]